MKMKLFTLLLCVMLSLTGCFNGKKDNLIADVSPGLEMNDGNIVSDAATAVEIVLKDHPEFPKAGEVKKIETTAGGPAPGTKLNGELTTAVEHFTRKEADDAIMVDLDSYVVTLTKKWNITVNGKEAKSVWKYKVTRDAKVELISGVENDDLINSIK